MRIIMFRSRGFKMRVRRRARDDTGRAACAFVYIDHPLDAGKA